MTTAGRGRYWFLRPTPWRVMAGTLGLGALSNGLFIADMSHDPIAAWIIAVGSLCVAGALVIVSWVPRWRPDVLLASCAVWWASAILIGTDSELQTGTRFRNVGWFVAFGLLGLGGHLMARFDEREAARVDAELDDEVPPWV